MRATCWQVQLLPLTRVGGAITTLLGLHAGQGQGSQEQEEGGAEGSHFAGVTLGGMQSAWGMMGQQVVNRGNGGTGGLHAHYMRRRNSVGRTADG